MRLFGKLRGRMKKEKTKERQMLEELKRKLRENRANEEDAEMFGRLYKYAVVSGDRRMKKELDELVPMIMDLLLGDDGDDK